MRAKSLQVRRAVVCVLLGFLGRLIYEQIKNSTTLTSVKGLGQNCFLCHIDDACPLCPPTKVDLTLDRSIASPYKPKGMYEVMRWLYFNEDYVYDIINEEPKLELNRLWKSEFKAVTQVGLDYINRNQMLGQSWSLVRLQNGYTKSDSIRGTDYMLDLLVTPASINISKVKTERVFRVQMVHPLVSVEKVKVLSVEKEIETTINIVIPIPPDFDRLEDFAKDVSNAAMKVKETHIILVLFYDTKQQMRKREGSILTAISKGSLTNKIIVLEQSGPFNYLTGVHTGTKAAAKTDLILAMTVDTFFSPALLNRCRYLAFPTKKVYFPVAFAQFDPSVVEDGMPPGKPKNINKKDHSRFSGQWDYQTHCHVCAYHSDLTEALESGIPTGKSTRELGRWLYDKFLVTDIQVISAVEPHLFKHHNTEQCFKHNLLDAEKKRCLKRKSENLGSKMALGILYINEVLNKRKQ